MANQEWYSIRISEIINKNEFEQDAKYLVCTGVTMTMITK